MNQAQLEGLKEVGRWLLLLVGSFVVTQLLSQAMAVPESYLLKVWVFVFDIPVRLVFVFVLTSLGRFVDKWQHEKAKLESGDNTKGFLHF